MSEVLLIRRSQKSPKLEPAGCTLFGTSLRWRWCTVLVHCACLSRRIVCCACVGAPLQETNTFSCASPSTLCPPHTVVCGHSFAAQRAQALSVDMELSRKLTICAPPKRYGARHPVAW